MAKKKYTFPEPGCRSCENYRTVGGFLDETRYCMGVKSKKGKRFKSSDPKYKAPRWCPKRIVPVCRIYTLADERAWVMDMAMREGYDPEKNGTVSVLPINYRLRHEMNYGLAAKAFYETAVREDIYTALGGEEVRYGEIIEIDDGLKPYYFYYYGWNKLIPVSFFDRTRTQPARPGEIDPL